MITTTFSMALIAAAIIFFGIALFTSVDEPPVCYVFRAALAFISTAITWVITILAAFGQVGDTNYQVITETVSGGVTTYAYEALSLPLGSEAVYVLALIAFGFTAFLTLQVIALIRCIITGLNRTGEEEGEEE